MREGTIVSTSTREAVTDTTAVSQPRKDSPDHAVLARAQDPGRRT